MEILLLCEKIQTVRRLLDKQEARQVISPLSVHLCYHCCPKQGVPAEQLREFLQNFTILTLDNYVVSLAQKRFTGKGLEDCLQTACAELNGCDEIITLDKNFAKVSGTSLPVRVIGHALITHVDIWG